MLRPCWCGKNFSQEEGSLAFPSYLGRTNFLSIFLQNLANTDSWLGRRVTHEPGHSFSMVGSLLAGSTLSPHEHFDYPRRATQSRRVSSTKGGWHSWLVRGLWCGMSRVRSPMIDLKFISYLSRVIDVKYLLSVLVSGAGVIYFFM